MHLLISMCLLGIPCRYDGKAGQLLPELERLQTLCTLIPVCPEQLGGLPTPRLPSERTGTHVLAKDGTDVTAQYQAGAQQALALAKRFGCRGAILKRKAMLDMCVDLQRIKLCSSTMIERSRVFVNYSSLPSSVSKKDISIS